MADPGWHRDPTGRFAHRYFDGARWTSHVSLGDGRTAMDPLAAVNVPVPHYQSPASAGPVVTVVANGIATAALVLGIIAVLVGFTIIGFFIAFPVAVLALVLGLVGRNRARQLPGQHGHGRAIGGVALGATGLVLSVVGFIVVVAVIHHSAHTIDATLDAPNHPVVGQLGRPIRGGDWELTVTEVVNPALAPAPFGSPQAGARLVSVNLVATNRSTTVRDGFPLLLAHLEDSAGHHFTTAPDSTMDTPLGGLAAGDNVHGHVTFEVSDTSAALVLGFQPGPFDHPIRIPLS
jgi:Protein of unknown function (DUF2510)